MSSFCKSADCPSSQRLLAFQTGEIDQVEERAISAHLSLCEFCEAEVDFYEYFPPVDEKVVPAKMPRPLFELAAALMGDRRGPSFSNLSSEIDHVYDDGV
ncbi:MAG: hypothetical protein ABI791_10870 [Acidobacteriota bacterium]